jgi:hypothetical protein
VISKHPTPDRDRLSTLTALVFLTYALIRIISLPTLEAEFVIFGVLIRIVLNTRLIILSVAALITAAGADWLVRSHPAFPPGDTTLPHWIVPGMAALGTGGILTRLPQGLALWIGLPLGALILVGVLYAEFLVIDRQDERFGMASIGLRTLTYMLLAGTIFTLGATGQRAIYGVPVAWISIFAATWRLELLEGRERKASLLDAAVMGAIGAQILWATHYWPISPVRLALVIGLLVYLGNGLIDTFRDDPHSRGRVIEFALLGLIGYGAIFTLT